MGCEPEQKPKTHHVHRKRKLNLPEGVPPLTSLYLYIAGSCNLACRHCWIEPDFQAGKSEGKFIQLEHVDKAIRQAKPLGLCTAKLTGGEPTLHPRFREIVDLIDSHDIRMNMETNGILIDNDMARFLKSKKHFSFASVSVDGANATTHEWLRGVEGSFDQAVSGIRALTEAGFRPQMICTLHKKNVDELQDIVNLAHDLGCGSIKFNHVQHIGRGDHFAAEYGFSVRELIDLFHHVEKDIQPEKQIKIHFDIPMAFYPIKKFFSPGGRCHILNILGILSNGDMSICGIGVAIPELVFGNLGHDDLQKVWTQSEKLAELRRLIPDQFEGVCDRCLHKFQCLGSCIAHNYFQHHKFNAPYFFCRQALDQGLFPATRLR